MSILTRFIAMLGFNTASSSSEGVVVSDEVKAAEVAHDYNYFNRYKNQRRFGRAWWYAFGSAALYFLPTLGMALEGAHVAIAHISISSLPAFFVSVLAPLPLTAIALVVFAIISGFIAYYHFKEVFEKCQNAYEHQEKLKRLLYLDRRIKSFLTDKLEDKNDTHSEHIKKIVNGMDSNTGDFQEDNVIIDEHYGKFAKFKHFAGIVVHSICGAIGWLTTLSLFTGWHLWSTASFFAVPLLGFVSPFILAITFSALFLLAKIWVEGIADIRYDQHQKIQQAIVHTLTHQIATLRSHIESRGDLKNDREFVEIRGQCADHAILSTDPYFGHFRREVLKDTDIPVDTSTSVRRDHDRNGANTLRAWHLFQRAGAIITGPGAPTPAPSPAAP